MERENKQVAVLLFRSGEKQMKIFRFCYKDVCHLHITLLLYIIFLEKVKEKATQGNNFSLLLSQTEQQGVPFFCPVFYTFFFPKSYACAFSIINIQLNDPFICIFGLFSDTANCASLFKLFCGTIWFPTYFFSLPPPPADIIQVAGK